MIQVMVLGQYKLVVAQQDPRKTNSGPTLGWRCGGNGHPRCDTAISFECGENPDTKGASTPQCAAQWVNATAAQCSCGCSYEEREHFVPCLFDVNADSSEFTDISAKEPAVRERIWSKLNLTNLELYMHRGVNRVENGTGPGYVRKLALPAGLFLFSEVLSLTRWLGMTELRRHSLAGQAHGGVQPAVRRCILGEVGDGQPGADMRRARLQRRAWAGGVGSGPARRCKARGASPFVARLEWTVRQKSRKAKKKKTELAGSTKLLLHCKQ